MSACAELQPLLLDRAAGLPLAAAGRALDEHLSGCAACRAEADALEETLALVRLPPAGRDELAALDGLAAALLEARRRGRGRAASWLKAGAGAAVAAAVLAALALPALWRPVPEVSVAELAAARAAAEAAAWQPPDPDELLAAAAELWPAAGTVESAGALEEQEVVLAAAEEWSETFPDVE